MDVRDLKSMLDGFPGAFPVYMEADGKIYSIRSIKIDLVDQTRMQALSDTAVDIAVYDDCVVLFATQQDDEDSQIIVSSDN